jgi:hypothetical protein
VDILITASRPIKSKRTPILFPNCRLLPAINIPNHISKTGLGGRCYSFSVGFVFQKERAPLLAKIRGTKAVRKVQ